MGFLHNTTDASLRFLRITLQITVLIKQDQMVNKNNNFLEEIKRIGINRQNSCLHSSFLFVQEKGIYSYYSRVFNEAVPMKFYSSVMLGLKWSTKSHRLKSWSQPMAFSKCSTLRRLDLTGSIGACPWRDQWDPSYDICTSNYQD